MQAADFTPLNKSTAAQLLDPASHRQPTIVALWSSDCSHCKKNLELLSTLVKSNKQLRVITVAAEPDSAILGPLLDRYHLPGPRYAVSARRTHLVFQVEASGSQRCGSNSPIRLLG